MRTWPLCVKLLYMFCRCGGQLTDLRVIASPSKASNPCLSVKIGPFKLFPMALVDSRVASLALWTVGIDVVGRHHSVAPMSVCLCSCSANKEHHVHVFFIFQCLSVPHALTATIVISWRRGLQCLIMIKTVLIPCSFCSLKVAPGSA